jgi:hypothetical protein
MPQKQRKFTNGYYLSFDSDCDSHGNIGKDTSDFSKNKREEDNVDTLYTKWSKVKQLQKKTDSSKSELLKFILPGNFKIICKYD